MKVNGIAYRSLWPAPDRRALDYIDQTRLPHEMVIARATTLDDCAEAIRSMRVRGAPLIGAAAAYAVALAMNVDATDAALHAACNTLAATRPTAVNLRWALHRMQVLLSALAERERSAAAWREAAAICDEDVAINRAIGAHGLALLRDLAQTKNAPLNVMTHCNAGWLATVDYGTALAPVYRAFDEGIDVHVWVSETRPRNQGAALTAWELGAHGLAHTLIVDSAAGHLLQRGLVDVVLVGADRVSRNGDVANKIGTYLKALAAREAQVPFYAAVPSPTLDWTIDDGVAQIPIETRAGEEVSTMRGRAPSGEMLDVALAPAGTRVANAAFDVTPARLVTGLITERGVCLPSNQALAALFPERIDES